tara:strand:- start:3248 stop:3421 length:174 start_codon:yes stop_codon:yes gene_type:complete
MFEGGWAKVYAEKVKLQRATKETRFLYIKVNFYGKLGKKKRLTLASLFNNVKELIND